KAGRGRSATMVLCWLVAKKGMTPEQAFAFLKQKRPHVCQMALRPVVDEFQKPNGT
ncbi:MAG: dual specificity protein phosphatase family protein, partial [Pirellulaceae bacterium]